MLSDELLHRALVLLPNNDAGTALGQDIRAYLREFTEVNVVDYSAIRDEAVGLLNGILASRQYQDNAFITRLRNSCQTNSANAKRVVRLHNYVKGRYTVDSFYNTISRDRIWGYTPYDEGMLPGGEVEC